MAMSLEKLSQPGYRDGLSYLEYSRKEYEDVRNLIMAVLKKLDLPIEP